MRLVIKKYADGGESIVETTDDGGVEIKQLEGAREVGKRISVYLEVTADDNEKGTDDLIKAISWLQKEAEKRKHALATK